MLIKYILMLKDNAPKREIEKTAFKITDSVSRNAS